MENRVSVPRFNMLSRRNFLGLIPGVMVGSAFAPSMASAHQTDARLYPEFPAQDPVKVMAVVGASHRDLDKVKELVGASPSLAKAAWDWGFGDWETALGAASHVGRHDIVEYLIALGARPDIFTFAMMGNVEVVKSMIVASPGIQKAYGPHSISLMRHAESGGDRAKGVVEYLKSIGEADIAPADLSLTDAQKEVYVGWYAFPSASGDGFVVAKSRQGRLTIQRNGKNPLNMFRVEDHGFCPPGASSVRIRFRVENGKAVAVTVHDPAPVITALRA